MRTRLAALLVAAALIGPACGGGDDAPEGAVDPTTTTTRAGGADASGATCDQEPTLDPVEAEPVESTPSDIDLTSFDGTRIRAHWFPAPGAGDDPAPTILMGPGWSLPGSTLDSELALFAPLEIGRLNDEGYNVLTWDPRGFGASEGRATVNAADTEGRDVQGLLDWVAEQPEAQLDGPGDPRSGMVGFSYGGGIQLTVAAVDCRVDALVPGLAWHSLESSLYKQETVKAGWASVLTSTTDPDSLDPHIVSARDSGLATGTLSAEDEEWFRDRGPADAVADISVPTLLVAGTADTLFTLQEAVTVAELIDDEVPVSMLWFCGGHGVCLVDPGDPDRIGDASFAWLARWVKGDESVELGPAFDVIDQDGTRWTGEVPPEADGEITARGSGTLALTADSVAGPIPVQTGSADPLAGVVQGITPAPATGPVVEVPVPAPDVATLVLGAPTLRLTYTGTTPDGERPTRVFAQLVDDQRDVVVGTLITPVAVDLDGQEHTVEVPMEIIAQHLAAGDTLRLQIVATTPAYAEPRLGGEIELSDVALSLPVVTSLERG